MTHSTDHNPKKNAPYLLQNSSITSPILIRTFQTSSVPYVIIGILLAIGTGFAVNFTSTYPPLLVIGGAIALILAISVFQNPELGAYILIFSVFTNLSDLFTEKGLPSFNKPMVGIIALSVFANYILKTGKLRPLPSITRIEFALGVYLLSILASSFIAVDQSIALSSLFDLFKDVAVCYCIYITLDTQDKVKKGLRILLIAITFASILGVIRTLTGTSNDFWGFAQLSAFNQVSDTDGQLRYGGPIGESNIWGQVLVSAIPIILYIIAKERDLLPKFLPAAAGLFIILAMFFTESRGAFVALVFVLGLMAIDLKIKGSTLLSFITIIFLVLLVLPEKYSQRIMSLDVFFQKQEYGLTQDESINGRRAKMLTGLAMFTSNPFLGVGFSNYSNNYWIYAGNLGLDSSVLNVGESEGDQQEPHSLYVEIISETGIFGISSFLTFLGFILIGLHRSRVIDNTAKSKLRADWRLLTASIMMSLLTYLVAGFFLHGIGFRFIWVLIGISLAFIHLSQPKLTSDTTT